MKKILKGHDYDGIDEVANDLIEDLGLRRFPLDCFEVAFLLGIELRQYSGLSEQDRIFVESRYKDGYSVRTAGKYVISYNDSMNRNRVKFTIWHEIAHIQLGHFEGACAKSEALMEEEANHFAAYVMAPLAFVHKLGLFSPAEIAEVCEISFECACNVHEHYVRAFRFAGVRNAIINGRIAKLLTFSGEVVA